MIFVTINLIDVYGSEIQECEGKRRKGSKLMDREGSGGCLREGEAVIMGGCSRLWANCGGDCGLMLQGEWRQGLHTVSCKGILSHSLSLSLSLSLSSSLSLCLFMSPPSSRTNWLWVCVICHHTSRWWAPQGETAFLCRSTKQAHLWYTHSWCMLAWVSAFSIFLKKTAIFSWARQHTITYVNVEQAFGCSLLHCHQ